MPCAAAGSIGGAAPLAGEERVLVERERDAHLHGMHEGVRAMRVETAPH